MTNTTILPEVNGHRIAVRTGQLIVCGEEQLDDLQSVLAQDYNVPQTAYLVYENREVNEWRTGSGLPKTYLIHGLPDSDYTLEVMVDVSIRFVEVQLNHVHFAHQLTETGVAGFNELKPPPPDKCCEPGDDLLADQTSDGQRSPATRLNPWTVNSLTVNGLTVNPWTVNPWTVNPWTVNSDLYPWTVNGAPMTSAIPASAPEGDDSSSTGSGEGVDVWILDTGLGDFDGNAPTPLSADPEAPGRSLLALPQGRDYRIPGLAVHRADFWDRPDLRPLFGDGYIDATAGHGTFIAAIYASLVPQCRLTVRSVVGPMGDVSESTIAAVLGELLSQRDADRPVVVNMSFGAYYGESDHCLRGLLDFMNSEGIAVVASAGNDGSCRHTYPAAYESVVGVGAVGPSGRAQFSNYGSWVNAWAPGVDLVSRFLPWNGGISQPFGLVPELDLVPDLPGSDSVDDEPIGWNDPDDFSDGWATWSGTSFAAPVVGSALAHWLGEGLSLADALATVGWTAQEDSDCSIAPIQLPWDN